VVHTSRSGTNVASPDAKGVDIGGGSGLPMATPVVAMLVPMEAVVVASTRRRCGGSARGRCCPDVGGGGIRSLTLVMVVTERATQRNFSEAPDNVGQDEIFRGLIKLGLTPGPAEEDNFNPLSIL
jgi:hypothetical protein